MLQCPARADILTDCQLALELEKCLGQGFIFGLFDETGDSGRPNHNCKSCLEGQCVWHLGVMNL